MATVTSIKVQTKLSTFEVKQNLQKIGSDVLRKGAMSTQFADLSGETLYFGGNEVLQKTKLLEMLNRMDTQSSKPVMMYNVK
eukprot:CAMPEP_0114587266 /NCGR_PEP_ID=MMETSP0125-20121206/10271_1 /TAXON_ID=485358 ORGANISM="Aristerostoma sp., Strain ATCC 50986" /NCGR_SAMPLE_ID=MMETSP0125 /ASSEMBLY_ACC=CAM_ASM_000245 /LENGTH=81 /DNA_ID=CAMNT_0001783095 /DNA_START=582 /DNA_END=827 /DNA_ORIENTATION=-